MYIIMDDESNTIMVTAGPYEFQIIDNTLFSRDKTEIWGRNFKIGGTYPDCVQISVIYENNKPMYARMPSTLSDPECLFIRPLDKGSGTIIMTKTLLQYVYKQVPTLTHINFDDNSNIVCATEEELKNGTYKPMPLCYFSILFNGQTWYENYFNATQKDEVRHQQYRTRVTEFLYSPEFKTNIRFDRFVALFGKREEEMTELYQYYNNTNNFNDFFQSIPKQDRCRLVGPRIEQFMKFILNDVFSNENWIIHLPLEMSEGNNQTRKYYCPKGIITNNFQSQNICIFPEDV